MAMTLLANVTRCESLVCYTSDSAYHHDFQCPTF